MSDEDEKRARARIAVPLNARIVAGAEETELGVRDVSMSGIFLYSRSPQGPVGTLVTLKLALTAGIKPTVVHGRIVRVALDPNAAASTMLGVGVAFDPSGAEQQRSLLALLDRAMLGKGTNNRAFPRICQLLEARCGGKEQVKVLVRDIGEGGLGLTAERSFGKDEDVTVEIAAGRGGPLRLSGWVVSSEPLATCPGSHRVGVRFGGLSAETRGQLKQFLEALYRR